MSLQDSDYDGSTWGVSGNLKYIVLAWAATVLGFSMRQASALVGVVAVGATGALPTVAPGTVIAGEQFFLILSKGQL